MALDIALRDNGAGVFDISLAAEAPGGTLSVNLAARGGLVGAGGLAGVGGGLVA